MNILNLFGIQQAFAQTTTTAPATTTATQAVHQGGGFMSLIWMLVAFFAIFYFLLIRPQSKRAKEQRKLIDNLAMGDEVLTTSGIVGKIVEIKDEFVKITVAAGVDLTLQKNAVVAVLPKGTLKSID